MRVVDLVTEPFQLLNYLEVECIKELNTHGVLKITGIIDAENAAGYRKKAMEETWVRIKVKEDAKEESMFFYGILTSFSLKEEGQLYTLTMEIKTGSFLLDLIPHIRSFQDDSSTYKSLIKTCMDAEDGDFISTSKADQAIGGMLLQYKETSWAFIKRLANRAGTALVPEFVTKGKKLYFGYAGSRNGREIKSENYIFDRTYEEQEQKDGSEINYLASAERGICRIWSRELYELGETVTFHGAQYQIGKIVSQLVGEELVHEYYLMQMREMPAASKLNQKIGGISLKGTVKQVKRDKVQVTIQSDENKANSNYRWFDYATVYSTPDGTGWYCMPEPEDEIRVTFPDADEANVYVASSVHLQAGGGRSNPDEKSWKNKQNKEILFTPDSLILRNNKGLLMELSDKDGIKIVSDKGIVVEAGKDIQISSRNAAVQVQGKNKISLSQGCAQLSIADEINMAGGKINMN